MAPAQVFIILGAFFGKMFVVKPTFLNLAFIPSPDRTSRGICAGLAYTDGQEAGESGEKARLSSFFSAFSCIVILPWSLHYEAMTAAQTVILFCRDGGGWEDSLQSLPPTVMLRPDESQSMITRR